jgi:hypothetical protein
MVSMTASPVRALSPKCCCKTAVSRFIRERFGLLLLLAQDHPAPFWHFHDPCENESGKQEQYSFGFLTHAMIDGCCIKNVLPYTVAKIISKCCQGGKFVTKIEIGKQVIE